MLTNFHRPTLKLIGLMIMFVIVFASLVDCLSEWLNEKQPVVDSLALTHVRQLVLINAKHHRLGFIDTLRFYAPWLF